VRPFARGAGGRRLKGASVEDEEQDHEEVHEVQRSAQLLGVIGPICHPLCQVDKGIRVPTGADENVPRIESVVPFDSPAYRAGLDLDDVIVGAGGTTIRRASDFHRVLQSKRPGDVLPLVLNRRGSRVSTSLTLVEDPSQRMVPVEQTGQSLTDAQRRFRAAWLSSAARNAF